ncbi:hypothetical protein [Frankia sp. QA3]|uniref:hypothetical protein n=1 Tax=Frankia sp. QA3 TaxID=710111 RepID=UPI000269C97B|nr:hypothetical protein [Frankia sp. QA3]EIV93749.1 hypothetical protein FraQA3DRAFT_3462 [Frankia sp. QA3]
MPAVALAVSCLAAAGWGLRPSGLATRATDVGCYSAVSLTSDTAVIGGQAAADPVAACRDIWQRPGPGTGAGAGADPRLGQNTPAAACLRDDGSIAVFPARDACTSLGLRPFAGVSDAAQRFAAFQREAIDIVAADRCRPRPQIISVLRQKLDAYGLRSWSIDDSGFGQPWERDLPCASLAFDRDRSSVLIVPFPRPSGRAA